MLEVIKEVIFETVMFYFIWLGLPALIYGLLMLWINIPTIKARRRKRRPAPAPEVRKWIIEYPDGRKEEKYVG